MTENQNQTPDQNHDDDTEGHFAALDREPGFAALGQEPGFVVDVPNQNDDDAEGHLSGARHIDPDQPSAARDPQAVHPKSTDDKMAF